MEEWWAVFLVVFPKSLVRAYVMEHCIERSVFTGEAFYTEDQ